MMKQADSENEVPSGANGSSIQHEESKLSAAHAGVCGASLPLDLNLNGLHLDSTNLSVPTRRRQIANERQTPLPSTRTILYKEIRRLIKSPKDEVLLGSFADMCKGLPRVPVVFLAYAKASIGDRLPFMRAIHELSKCFPGEYNLLFDKTKYDTCDAYIDRECKCVLTDINVYIDRETWLEHLGKATHVDAVITNQWVNWFRAWEDSVFWGRMYRRVHQHNAAWINVEFQWLGSGLYLQQRKWSEELAHGKTSMAEYQEKTEMYTCREFPRLLLECYPAELLTEEELARPLGILCGHVKPLPTSQDYSEIDRFINEARAEGKRIVVLARGGGKYRSAANQGTCDTAMITDCLVALGNVAVVAMGRAGHDIKRTGPNTLIIPDMKYDFSSLFPKIDVVIHHGGAGTTLTAFASGTPQVIVPHFECCSDQLYQGSKVGALRCGIMLRPRQDCKSSGADKDIAQAVNSILKAHQDFKDSCMRWRNKSQSFDKDQDKTIAVEALSRLIAGIILDKDSGQWMGWTGEAKARDKKRYQQIDEILRNAETVDRRPQRTSLDGDCWVHNDPGRSCSSNKVSVTPTGNLEGSTLEDDGETAVERAEGG